MSNTVSLIAAPEGDREPNAQAAEAVRLSRSSGLKGGLTLQAPSGRHVELPLTGSALEAIEAVLERLGTPADLVVGQRDREVSPEAAAKLLGLSRPLVYRRMNTGRVPFRQVGSHRRIRLEDVMALMAMEDEKRAASRALARTRTRRIRSVERRVLLDANVLWSAQQGKIFFQVALKLDIALHCTPLIVRSGFATSTAPSATGARTGRSH